MVAYLQLMPWLLFVLPLVKADLIGKGSAKDDFLKPDDSPLSQLCVYNRRAGEGSPGAISLTTSVNNKPDNQQCDNSEAPNPFCERCAGDNGKWGKPCSIEPDDCTWALKRQLQRIAAIDVSLVITADSSFSSAATPLNGNFQVGMCIRYWPSEPLPESVFHKWLSNTGSATCTFLFKPTDDWYKLPRAENNINKTSVYKIDWNDVEQAVVESAKRHKNTATGCQQWYFPLFLKDGPKTVAPVELHVARLQKEC